MDLNFDEVNKICMSKSCQIFYNVRNAVVSKLVTLTVIEVLMLCCTRRLRVHHKGYQPIPSVSIQSQTEMFQFTLKLVYLSLSSVVYWTGLLVICYVTQAITGLQLML